MKRIIKSLAAVTGYLLILCYLLGTEAILLLSPKQIGMFLLGCVILCIPSLEEKPNRKEFRRIFKKNAIMAGYLETFVLLFAGVSQRKGIQGGLLEEFALSLRPIFYGFVCHMILQDDVSSHEDSESKDITEKDSEEKDSEETIFEEEISVQTKLTEKESMEMYSAGERIQETASWGNNLSGGRHMKEKEKQQKPDLSKLTRQEKLIAELIRLGRTNREIGEELSISEATVKKHISNIFEKTGISSRKELR